jgi:dihydropteroate synthase
MGILNVTPDSFSDGGQFLSPEIAIVHALQMLDEGADILDIGGESTRPGKYQPVTAEVERERVLPVIKGVLRKRPEAVISIDTYKSAVAADAVEAGAEIVNDVSGFQWDSNMAETIAAKGCGTVMMHMRGTPDTWRTLPKADDIVKLVMQGLSYQAATAIKFGVAREALVLDPGFGFGKNFEENYPLLARFEELHALGFPLLSGTSRKSFIGKTVAGDEGKVAPPDQRLFGTLASVAASVLKGAHLVRVHDVKAAMDAVRVADAILAETKT